MVKSLYQRFTSNARWEDFGVMSWEEMKPHGCFPHASVSLERIEFPGKPVHFLFHCLSFLYFLFNLLSFFFVSLFYICLLQAFSFCSFTSISEQPTVNLSNSPRLQRSGCTELSRGRGERGEDQWFSVCLVRSRMGFILLQEEWSRSQSNGRHQRPSIMVILDQGFTNVILRWTP